MSGGRWARQASYAAGSAGSYRARLCLPLLPGVLEPLVAGRPDFRPRVRQLAAAMGPDLLERVLEDSVEEDR